MEVRKILYFSVLAAIVGAGCNNSSGSSTDSPKHTDSDTHTSKSDKLPRKADGGDVDGITDLFSDEPTRKNGHPAGNGGADGGGADGGGASDGADGTTAESKQVELPPIFLSEGHQNSCILIQGDSIPDFELVDIEGHKQKLSDLLGKRLTLLCFWTGEVPAAFQQLQDLGPDIVDVYGAEGVSVVTVNFLQSADEAKAVASRAGATVPILLDSDGTVFAQVAKNYLPRTYLLDRDGKIIWFDLEYSTATQRHIDQAIQFGLAQP